MCLCTGLWRTLRVVIKNNYKKQQQHTRVCIFFMPMVMYRIYRVLIRSWTVHEWGEEREFISLKSSSTTTTSRNSWRVISNLFFLPTTEKRIHIKYFSTRSLFINKTTLKCFLSPTSRDCSNDYFRKFIIERTNET